MHIISVVLTKTTSPDLQKSKNELKKKVVLINRPQPCRFGSACLMSDDVCICIYMLITLPPKGGRSAAPRYLPSQQPAPPMSSSPQPCPGRREQLIARDGLPEKIK